MKHLLYGALVGLLWLVVGVPLAPVLAVLAAVAQPVTIAFTAGLLARPLTAGMRRRAA